MSGQPIIMIMIVTIYINGRTDTCFEIRMISPELTSFFHHRVTSVELEVSDKNSMLGFSTTFLSIRSFYIPYILNYNMSMS